MNLVSSVDLIKLRLDCSKFTKAFEFSQKTSYWVFFWRHSNFNMDPF